ncbi:hypothetical protein GCM10010400_22600 [Streptomyces aculeolatus]
MSYRSPVCHVGQHQECRHAGHKQPRATAGISYEQCDCPCHRASAERAVPDERATHGAK